MMSPVCGMLGGSERHTENFHANSWADDTVTRPLMQNMNKKKTEIRGRTTRKQEMLCDCYHEHLAIYAAELRPLHWWPGRCTSQNPPTLPLIPSEPCLQIPAVTLKEF